VVWPRFLAYPPVRGLSHLVERVGLFPLVAGGIWMVFSGVANIAQWYPWPFSFTVTHYWMAWVTMGALVAHVGAKWVTTRRALTRPSQRPPLAESDPVLGTVAEPAATARSRASLSRRGFLGTVAASSGLLTLTTVGQTVRPLRRLGLLAPRDPARGPQGYPVNRGAVNARVVDLARSPDYRLEVTGRVAIPLSLTLGQLLALPSSDSVLPIACVEGWSYSAAWRGVRVRDLLERAGADPDRTILIESLEPAGAYRTSTLNPGQAAADNTLLATHLDGQPLALDHGFPCRLIAPNRPGVLQTKWVRRVVVL
jgi:DMSO/TMAO reductase YedYZ molybdopterin-dependent catalytic subunit